MKDNDSLKASVIIATYNGEKYIEEQLLSILNQTVSPYEVLINDDCSADSTVKIIKSFIEKNNLSNWHIKVNTSNKGWKCNFYELMQEADGDLIFYCDQDDVWRENRIERTQEVFNSNDKIQCLICSYDSMDGDGKIFKHGENSRSILQIRPGDRKYYAIMGCLMVYRKSLNKEIFSIIDKRNKAYFSPDQVMARISCLMSGYYELREPLVNHRFHDGNTTNRIEQGITLSGSANLNERISLLVEQNEIMETILQKYKGREINYDMHSVKDIYDFTKKRIEYLTRPGMVSFWKLIKDIHFDNRLAVILADLAYALNMQKAAGKIYTRLRRV